MPREMQLSYVLLLVLVPQAALGGPQDTVDELRMGFTTVPLSDQVFNAPVSVEQGSCPTWLSGTLARHACGVYGETGRPTEDNMLNGVEHVFDCVEMGQGYSFSGGEVTFTSRFYDTSHVELWRQYEENMNQSSVWWHTLYGRQNLTSQADNGPLLDEIGQTRPGAVPAVSWWQVGQEVLGMSEWPEGQRVDVHSMVHLGDYDYKDRDEGNFLGEGFSNAHSAAHEQNEGGVAGGIVWSTVAAHKYEGDIGVNKRAIFTLDPSTKKREIVGEWFYNETDLSLCDCPDDDMANCETYPDGGGRLRQVHSVQMTEHFVVIPETNYMYDPCVRVQRNISQGWWESEYSYEADEPGFVTVMNKSDGVVVARVETEAFMITHVLGAYEDDEAGLLHFDALAYDDASPYTYFTYLDVILNGEPHPDFTRVSRFTLNMSDWTYAERKDLVGQNPDNEGLRRSFEFSNINPSYQGWRYKYAYMIQNMFKTEGALIKLNVDDGTVVKREMPDGCFPTEPIFVARPDAVEEDDGVVIFSGIDGGRERGFVMMYDAATMELLFQATAPKKTLFGIHSKFYSFDVGCSTMDNDCTPPPATATTPPAPGGGDGNSAANKDIVGYSLIATIVLLMVTSNNSVTQ